ncbi:MAG: tetratricopeptide repeat protein [Bryobacterales bacterium]|nr:tetratricopeptide repeat protein [Bryobacterales bacterium]
MTARTQRAKRPRKFRCRVVAAGMLLGAFTVMSAPLLAQTPQATLNRHLEQAQVHLDAQNYRLVVEALRQAIAIHPELPGAYYQLGLALWHLHDMEESRIAFLKELEFEPPDAYSLYYLGRIELSDGDTEAAIPYFERVLEIGTVLDVRGRLASGYLRTGRTGDAVRLLEESVRRRPEQGELHYLLGQAYQRQGRAEEARYEFDLAERWKNKLQEEIRGLVELRMLLQNRKLVEADAKAKSLAASGDPDVMLSAAIALGTNGFHAEALPVLRRVVELRPRYAEAFYNMALAHVSLEQPANAVPDLERAVELRPEFYEARMLLGNLLAGSGNHDAAIRHLRVASTIRPDNSKLKAFLGLQYLQGRYYDEAVKGFRTAVDLDPDNADLRFLLVDALHKNHDFERALAEAQSTLAQFPGLPNSHFQVAWQLENMGRFEEARGHLEEAIRIDGGFAEARRLLGEVVLRLGDAEGSLDHFRQAIEQDPASAQAYAGLGKALNQLRRYGETIPAMERAIAIDPELAALRLHLSQALRAAGRTEDAKREAAEFARLNKRRALRRDREVEREYMPFQSDVRQ